MTSAIDITKPVYGNPTTQSVRDNFSHAADEITALQSDVLARVLKTGDVLTGPLSLSGDPTSALHATSQSWVLNQIRSNVNALIYVGDYDAAADIVLTSGNSNIIAGDPLPPASSGNSQMFFTAKTGSSSAIGNQPPGGVPANSWLISNGVNWNVYKGGGGSASLTVSDTKPEFANGAMWFDSVGTQLYIGYDDGNSQQFVIANSIVGSTGSFLPIGGGTMTGPLLLAGNPAAALEAAPKQYVDTAASGSGNNTGRNFIHNGTWAVRQRGVGPWTTSQYSADRWNFLISSDTTSATLQALADSDRTAIGDEAATHRFNCIVTGNSAAGAYTVLLQHIEDVRRLAGKTITVSFWAASSVYQSKLGISIDQNFGTGGSPSTQVSGAGQAVTLDVVWKRYSVTFAVPSTNGKTLGTDPNTSHTVLHIWFSSGSTNATRSGNIGVQTATFTLWGIQLEIGSQVTALAKRELAEELRLCQRFYYANSAAFTGGGQQSVDVSTIFSFPVAMRVNPTVTMGTVTYSNSQTATVYTSTPQSATFRFQTIGTGAGGVSIPFTASADF